MVLSFLRNFAHVLALLLWLAALFAFVGGLAELGWAIIAVVLVNGVFTFAQEYRASKLLEALHGRLQPGARVRRQGEVVTVSSRDVVPGDIICLEEGVRIPADARLIAGSDLEVDQSSLTGESLPVSKTVEVTGGPGDLTLLSNIVFSGSLVTHGHGEALIYATGAASQFGTVSLLTYDLEEAKGPLAREVEALSITTAVTGIPLPLKVIQILAVDLGTDLVPALGLGAEPPEPGTLKEPPRPRDARLLDRAIFLRIFAFLGPIEAALGLAAFIFVYWTHGWRPGDAMPDSGHVYVLATTMTYAAIVVGQIGAGIACRSATTPGLHPARLPNRVLLAGIALEVLVLVLIGRVPPLQGTFGFAALGWREMAFLLAVCPLLPLADDLRKRLSARRKRQRE